MTGPVEVEGVRLAPAGDSVVRASRTRWAGRFEPESMDMWREAVRPGTVALDVGAYTGIYTVAAAQEGAHEVVAVEPNPVAADRLRHNVRANGVEGSVRVHQAAAGRREEAGRLDLGGRPQLTSAATVVVPDDGGVEVLDVDLMYWSPAPVSAIKVDVEGMELEVLAGALDTLHQHHPFLLVEALTEAAVGDLVGWFHGVGMDVSVSRADGRNLALRL